MSKNRNILVQDISITVSNINEQEFISLTDMVSGFEGAGSLIEAWLRNKDTIEFLGVWEKINNRNFNSPEFEGIRNMAGSNRFSLSAKKWIESTNAIGLIAKAGRYGGTFAHQDIAFEFGSWLSPEFKLYLIKEFQRLKELEAKQLSVDWQVKRELAKVNYRIHTDAIQQNLLSNTPTNKQCFVYASEADMLNAVVFGKTAKEWKKDNPNNHGNQRDHGSAIDNALIANLESYNALLIQQGLTVEQRISTLKDVAKQFRASMERSPAMKRLEEQSKPFLSHDSKK